MNRRAIFIATIIGTFVFAAPAYAQAGPLDSIVTSFQGVSTGWQAPLRNYAQDTFGILALISIVVTAVKLALRGADVNEFLGELVNTVFYLGIFWLLLENSVQYGGLIISSFRQAAASAGGGGVMSPTDVFNAGINLCVMVFNQTSLTHPGRDAMLAIGAIVIMAAYALIAAEMLVTLVESLIVVSASVIFMAFGALSFTKEIAISVLRYTFSVGAKLFILQLLVSVGQGLINQWTAGFTSFTIPAFVTIIGSSLVMLVVVKQIPSTIQGIVNGSHSVGSGSGLVAAGTFAAATAVAVGAAVAGAPVAAMQAARLAVSQASGGPSGGGVSGTITRAAGMAARTGGNMARAATADVGRKMSGQAGRGSAPWRMAADIAELRRRVDEDNNRPKPPEPPNTIS